MEHRFKVSKPFIWSSDDPYYYPSNSSCPTKNPKPSRKHEIAKTRNDSQVLSSVVSSFRVFVIRLLWLRLSRAGKSVVGFHIPQTESRTLPTAPRSHGLTRFSYFG